MESVLDEKGRIVLPKSLREKLGLKKGDRLIFTLIEDGIFIKKAKNPEKVLEEVLGDLTFDRSVRKISEREAMREVIQ